MSQSISPQPTIWSVVDQRLGGVDALLLGDEPNDRFRISVMMVIGIGGPEVEAQIVYPCRVCGWEFSCHNGEDCHS